MPHDETYDWSQFEVNMLYSADQAAVFDAWSTSGGMESFFARRFNYKNTNSSERSPTEIAVGGDSYWLAFHHPSELEGKVLVSVPPHHFAFTFGQMQIDVHLHPHERGTHLQLIQTGIPTDENGKSSSHLNCRSCWIYYLLNLRSVLEHGHDLRDVDLPDNPVSIHIPHDFFGGSITD